MAKTAFDASRSNLYNINPDDIIIIGLDTEDGPEHPLYDERVKLPLDEALVLNIMHLGKVIEPITVRKNGQNAEVVVGRQRVRCAREANKRLKKQGCEPVYVPSIFERGDDGRMFGFMISENEIRRADSLLIKAQKLQRYLGLGHSVEDAAVTFGVTPAAIRNWQSLLDLSKDVQKMVERGEISASAASKLAALPRDEQKAEAEKLVGSGKATTAQANRAAQQRQGKEGGTVRVGSKQIKEVLSTVKTLHPEARKAMRWVLGLEDVTWG